MGKIENSLTLTRIDFNLIMSTEMSFERIISFQYAHMRKRDFWIILHTVGFHKSLRGPSVWSKITLITGHVGGAGACPPTCKMRESFHSNKFQLNGASEETLKL